MPLGPCHVHFHRSFCRRLDGKQAKSNRNLSFCGGPRLRSCCCIRSAPQLQGWLSHRLMLYDVGMVTREPHYFHLENHVRTDHPTIKTPEPTKYIRIYIYCFKVFGELSSIVPRALLLRIDCVPSREWDRLFGSSPHRSPR